MADRFAIPEEAVEAQRRSSDPASSVWVSANAGAGKTYVLAQRVVRLLLSGVPPRAILCLTFTNAAAAEMAGRVFAELARLATLGEPALEAAVDELAPGSDRASAVRRARTLFAETLETPGGLKVATLHAFAAALLRRFPLEANVSGSFEVLDDATREELTEAAIATVLAEAVAAPDGRVARAIAAQMPYASDAGLVGNLKAVLARPHQLKRWLLEGAGTARLTADLNAALGHGEGSVGPAAIDESYCRRLVEVIEASGKSAKTAERLAAALGCPEGPERDRLWSEAFLTDKGQPRDRSRFAAKQIFAALPDLEELLGREQERAIALLDRAKAATLVAATVPLLQLAWRVLETLEGELRRRGLIDYDEQIVRAADLVRGGSAAAWVRHKLDEGVDHVMVDEAQDTSPAQWELVEALTAEFFAGEGARQTHRTLFVVGDEKQSIYSFQGAAPELFAALRERYDDASAAAGLSFRRIDLTHSFRSAPQVLSAVDRVFGAPPLAAAVGAADGVRHTAVRQGPGGVDLWPLLCDTKVEAPDDWEAPLDATPSHSGYVKLARAIAETIAGWTREAGPDGGAPLDPGDVLVLAKRREPFATLMNRELKARGIPCAGSDRLDVTRHIAVRDMIALAGALVGRDDLALAAVLKSPLFGFSEDELFRVAAAREGSLFAALGEGDDRARAAHATLTRWRSRARTDRPYDLFAAILIGEGRRADFAARMGNEAEDALDAFLDMVLALEDRGAPAMDTLLHRLSRTRNELRRSQGASGGVVRVMTVHGAKGLEAEAVFLADIGATANPRGNRPTLVGIDAETSRGKVETVLIAPPQEARPAALARVMEERQRAEAAEHARLLYVAMTRARRHLVVCGAYASKPPEEGMWHGMVREALAEEAAPLELSPALASYVEEGDAAAGLSWRHPVPVPREAAGSPGGERSIRAAEPSPPWLTTPAVVRRTEPEPLVPSSGGHAGASGEPSPVAVAPSGPRRTLEGAAHGAAVHDLLERDDLDAGGMAERLHRLHPDLAADAVAAIVGEARAVLALPELARGTLRREVALLGDVRLPDGEVRRVAGRIDRLQITADTALIVDYKTDRMVPTSAAAAPHGYKLQLALYRALVRQILPRHEVLTAIVWTAAPRLMAMDEALPAVGPAAIRPAA